MNYGELKAAVNTSAGPRDDIPEHIYTMALSEINRDIRIKEMQKCASVVINPATTFAELNALTACDAEALPADFLEMEEVFNNENGRKKLYTPTLRANQTELGNESARTYAITVDGMTLTGAPSEQFTLELLYYATNAALSSDADTNVVLLKYPDLYLALALAHTAVWRRDMDEAAMHRAEYARIKRDLKKADLRGRHVGFIRPTSLRVA